MIFFRILSGLTILLLCAGIIYDLKRRLKDWNAVKEFSRRHFFTGWQVLREAGNIRHGNILATIKRVLYVLSLISALILAFTGFFPVTVLGTHCSGVLLVIHVTIAPLFALCLCAVALLWAHRLRFVREDWIVFRDILSRRPVGEEGVAFFLYKIGFWTILVLSLPLIATVILELYPLFGTEGEEFLISLHGYSALALLLIGLIHTYLVFMFMNKSHDQY